MYGQFVGMSIYNGIVYSRTPRSQFSCGIQGIDERTAQRSDETGVQPISLNKGVRALNEAGCGLLKQLSRGRETTGTARRE